MDIVFDPNKNRMTNMQLCRLYMDEFVRSRERRWMLDGEAYYRVDNPEIMSRKMYRYREDKTTGQIERVLDKSKPNNKRRTALCTYWSRTRSIICSLSPIR